MTNQSTKGRKLTERQREVLEVLAENKAYMKRFRVYGRPICEVCKQSISFDVSSKIFWSLYDKKLLNYSSGKYIISAKGRQALNES